MYDARVLWFLAPKRMLLVTKKSFSGASWLLKIVAVYPQKKKIPGASLATKYFFRVEH